MTTLSNVPDPTGPDVARSDDGPLSRPRRQRPRAKADRGLPPDHELARLAAEYLRAQRKHWPRLVKAGLLPEPTDAVVAAMVEDFKHRHRTGRVDPESLAAFRKFCPKLGGNYNRYSCDNSSPTSIIDQMVHGLDKARQEDRFVAWSYLFCDYSVSGLNPSRQGYTSYKKVLQHEEHFVETTYIDDFTRASRDEIEWWKLAHLSRRLGKRMIGASDGFDLSAADWDVKISLYGLISRLFVKGLREKVRRGMRGAARRGTCLGKLPLGFTRCVCRDEGGSVRRGPDDRPIYRPCIDPDTRAHRALLYELFAQKRWSLYRIAKHFNALKVEGWAGWSESAIKNLLRSASAIGVFIWNRTRQDYDWDREKWVAVGNPRSQWEVYHDPDLAIVPMALWAAARKRLSAMRRKSPLTGRTRSRNEKSATTLFSATLYCSYCGRELRLTRSAGKYKVMGCLHGPTGAHDCRLSASKSTRIVEASLLGFLRDRLLTEEVVGELVAEANAFLAEEARRPRVDTAPLKAAVRGKEEAIRRLFGRIEGQADEALVQAYEKRVADLQREVNGLKAELRKAEAGNVAPPAPLDRAAVAALLGDLRGLLNQEVPAAAEAVRDLTGPIRVRQEPIPGRKRGARWIATFSPDLLGWLRRGARGRDCPESISLEYLSRGNWIKPVAVEVVVEHLPKYEQIAPEVAKLADGGASLTDIATVLGQPFGAVQSALRFARTGVRPKPKPPGKRTGSRRGPPKFQALASEVARLRDEECVPFTRIANRLKLGEGTARRAYDFFHFAEVAEAVRNGRRPDRGQHVCIPIAQRREVVGRLERGESVKTVAAEIGCSVSTVRRIRREEP